MLAAFIAEGNSLHKKMGVINKIYSLELTNFPNRLLKLKKQIKRYFSNFFRSNIHFYGKKNHLSTLAPCFLSLHLSEFFSAILEEKGKTNTVNLIDILTQRK